MDMAARSYPSGPTMGAGMKKWLFMLTASAVTLSLAGCNGSSDPAIMPAAVTDSQGIVQYAGEPALDVAQDKLDASLHCTDFNHPDKPPVLLVHGTFTRGQEQWDWTYVPLLTKRGYDVCTVTYPDRGLGDQQVSAEYVVNALRTIHNETGRKVAMIGHSQGATMPRWAIKFWPSARNAVADFVLLAGPNHGTTVADPGGLLSSAGAAGLPLPLIPAGFFQFSPDSKFVKVLNHGDETPGDIDYTSIYGKFDELVEPSAPVPTAALDWQQHNPHVSNILLQNVCPGYVVEHVTIGTTDALAFKLTLDAISHPGPASVERARKTFGNLCNKLLPALPQEELSIDTITGLLSALQSEGLDSIPDPHLAKSEPPLKPYAQGILKNDQTDK